MEEKIKIIKERISQAAERSGRSLSDITIVAASKTVEPERLSLLKSMGIEICGENRVQELVDKFGRVDTTWHMIGQLQTNKVKYIIDKVDLIQSLNRISLAEEIEKQAKKKGIIAKCLVEVNVADELSKGGIPKEQLINFLDECQRFESVSICGLMAIMPLEDSLKKNPYYYLQMRELYDMILMSDRFSKEMFRYLSMGMSEDYELAVSCGSNMVRIGSAIFGKRS